MGAGKALESFLVMYIAIIIVGWGGLWWLYRIRNFKAALPLTILFLIIAIYCAKKQIEQKSGTSKDNAQVFMLSIVTAPVYTVKYFFSVFGIELPFI
jgi:hypothetical protein